ncbi:hypothetical protein Efla_000311 [Eimeria flavescens]
MSVSEPTAAGGPPSVCCSLRAAMRGLSYVGAESLSDEEAQRMWLSLKDAFSHIFNHNAASLSFEELYRYAYTLVLHKRGQNLYEGTYLCVEAQLRGVAAAIRRQTDARSFMDLFLSSWNDHAVNMGLASDILMYLDKNFVPPHRLTPVYAMGMQLFYELVLKDREINRRFREHLLSLILADRNGEAVELRHLRLAVNMLTTLRTCVDHPVYTEEFEVPFLESTRRFYEEETARLIETHSATDFLKKAQARMSEESVRVVSHMNEETGPPLTKLLYGVWIAAHYRAVASNATSGGPFLIRNDCLEDLHRMYCLFSRVPGAVDELKEVMKRSLEDYGQAILSDPEKTKDPVTFVTSFLSLKNKFQRIVQTAFCDDQELHATMKTAFEGFLCSDSRSPSFLSSYLDDFFRKGVRNASEEAIQETLEGLLSLFRYLRDKDLFVAYYKQLLSRRLLQNRTGNIEAEKLFVDKLRAECGQQYTAKLESMFRDLLIAGQLMDEFTKHKMQMTDSSLQCGHTQWVDGPNSLGSRAGGGAAAQWEQRLDVCPAAAADGGGSGAPPAVSGEGGEDQWTTSADCYGGTAAAASGTRQEAGFHGLRGAACTPEFECTVLTHATWFSGGESISDLSLLPPSLHWPVDAFTSFYLSRHSGRVLKFALEEGRALVRGTFAKSRHELECSTLQMCILCLFNEFSSISVGLLLSRLKEKAGQTFPEAELRRQLTSLCTPKCKLLSRRVADGAAATRELQDSDFLEVNLDFCMRFIRVKVPLVTLASLGGSSPLQLEPQAGADVPASVEQDRNHLVEAAIVRVMKGRQRIMHNELVAEVCSHLAPRFLPSPALIKHRIEMLIDREYIQRGPEDM